MNHHKAASNDLQQAIDDITNSTNSDPVFTDPVAAPAPVEEIALDETITDLPPIETPADSTMPPADFAAPEAAPVDAPLPPTEPAPIITETETVVTAPANSDMHSIKEAALRDLAPLLGQMDLAPEQKFDLYKDMIDNLHDHSVVSNAYESARQITDEKGRGEALLYLIKTIDEA